MHLFFFFAALKKIEAKTNEICTDTIKMQNIFKDYWTGLIEM